MNALSHRKEIVIDGCHLTSLHSGTSCNDLSGIIIQAEPHSNRTQITFSHANELKLDIFIFQPQPPIEFDLNGNISTNRKSFFWGGTHCSRQILRWVKTAGVKCVTSHREASGDMKKQHAGDSTDQMCTYTPSLSITHMHTHTSSSADHNQMKPINPATSQV